MENDELSKEETADAKKNSEDGQQKVCFFDYILVRNSTKKCQETNRQIYSTVVEKFNKH